MNASASMADHKVKLTTSRPEFTRVHTSGLIDLATINPVRYSRAFDIPKQPQ